MKKANFVERVRSDHHVNQTVKKEVPWQPAFDTFNVGTVFEAEFGAGGKTMDFKVVNIIHNSDPLGLEDSRTFYIEHMPPTNPCGEICLTDDADLDVPF